MPGLFHTGIFLRPRNATSLQALIRNRLIQDRAKFSVAKSQMHPNGLCEIVVKRQDLSVSTNTIMELLDRCRALVEEQTARVGETRRRPDLDGTIDVSDSDDSICVISPSHSGTRKISFKRTLSIDSPSRIKDISQSPSNQSVIEPVFKRQNLIINVNSQPSSSNEERKVLLQTKECVNAYAQPLPKQPLLCSPNASSKIDNILIKVMNNNTPSSASQCDDPNSSVTILDVIEDASPSAPTWTTSQGSTFPLNSISQNLGKNLAMFAQVKPIENPVASCRTDLEKMEEKSDVCNPGSNSVVYNPTVNSVRRFSDVVKENYKPKVNTSCEPAVSLGRSKDQVDSVVTGRYSCGLSTPTCTVQDRQDGDVTETSNALNQNMVDKIKGGPIDNSSKVSWQVTIPSLNTGLLKESMNKVADQSDKEKTNNNHINEKCVERASSSASGELTCDDDDIIIEKELKSTNKCPSLIIEDSDDDIAVCEVVKKKGTSESVQVINAPLLSKRQKKLLKSKNKWNQLEKSVASTSSGPALDFIPLSGSSGPSRWQNSLNHPVNVAKASKFKKLDSKKERKARALERSKNQRLVSDPQLRCQTRAAATDTIQSGQVDSSSEQPQNSSSEKKDKREFSNNIFNPNPENPKTGLRPVVIDASNVAIGHGRGAFSVRGLKICIKYFEDRGHKVIAFAPKYRRFHVSPEDRKALDELETQGILSFTPSRTMVDGRKVASYDDRYIVQVAAELGGVVISTDNYRDLLVENDDWRETIEQRLLMFTWVGDMLLFPNDPLGRNGPHLQDFLRFPDSSPKK